MRTKNIRTNLAVAEIIGTIIMLGIATTSLSSVSYYVLSAPAPIPTPIVEMSGMIDDNQVIVTHRGGEPLDLDTELLLNVGGSDKIYKVGDFLDSEAKEDGVWSLGEKVVYPIDYDFDYSEYPKLEINVIDRESNSLIMTGITKVNPTCDISVEIAVDNLCPRELENVEFTITVTNEGNINASGILIEFLSPEGLTYFSSTVDMGTYASSVGIWDIGQIPKGESTELKITATVEEFCYSDPTQLVFLLDGSGSIEPANWTLMLDGISAVVKNESSFPHSGAVELTVIQFGGFKPAYARLEIGPIAITKSNVDSVVDDVKKIKQMGEKTPLGCAILLAADVLKASDMFDPDVRQVVLLVTDGNPTHGCYVDGDYLDDKITAIGPKDIAVSARDYLVDILDLNENDDEFNALSIEVTGDGHTYYLRDDLVWPQPGIEVSDLTEDALNKGWVRPVSSWQDFALSINASFEVIFNRIPIDVSIKSTVFSDPKDANDLSRVVLEPIPSFIDIKEELIPTMN